MCRDQKHRSVYTSKAFTDTHKDFERLIKMKGLGREIKPGSYKRLTVSHLNHGTDSWEIRIHTERSFVSLNKDNWKSFTYWVKSLMYYAPSSAVALMEKYPHVKVNTWPG